MSLNLSSAAVVIGPLTVKSEHCENLYLTIWGHCSVADTCQYCPVNILPKVRSQKNRPTVSLIFLFNFALLRSFDNGQNVYSAGDTRQNFSHNTEKM